MATRKINIDSVPVTFNNVLIDDLVGLLRQATKYNVTYYKPLPPKKKSSYTPIHRENRLPSVAIEMVRNTEDSFVIPSSSFDWIQLYCDARSMYYEVEPIKDGLKILLWQPPYEPAKFPRLLNDY